ncbi:MAG: PIN domain-containing protein [Nitrospira sp.]|nr:PIN domain-containing protein [Nitrospira sp.]
MNGTLVDRLRGKRCICLDTNVLIYFVQQTPQYISIVDPLFIHLSAANLPAISSYLTLLEVMVHPLRNGNRSMACQYRDILLNSNNIRLLPLEQTIAEHAAEIRARFNFKTPDCIQLATAVRERADVFVTNDSQLKRFSDLEVLVLDDFLLSGHA